MVYLKLSEDRYQSEAQLIGLMHSISNPEACRLQIGGGVGIESSIFADPAYIIEQFLAAQGSGKFQRRACHLAIKFEGWDITDFDFAYWTTREVCRIYRDYQSIFTVQDNHIRGPEAHIVFNNYPIKKGCRPQLAKVFDPQFIVGMVGHMEKKYHMSPVQQIYLQENALGDKGLPDWRRR